MTTNFEVGVVIPAFGDLDFWRPLATRALRSVECEMPSQIEYIEGANLHEARNIGLDRLKTPWAIFVDADDELEAGYFDAMAAATGDIRVPRVRYFNGQEISEPLMPRVAGHTHSCTADCLPFGNWIVIGAAARTDLVRAAGGWRDFPMYEDWDLWARCHRAGATITPAPDAIYRARRRPNSRNRGPSRKARIKAHQEIARANGLPVPA